MRRFTHLTRISILLAVFFALDKVVAILRQVIIARQFGLSAELDAFNVANNVPDLLFALISGGALAMAFIPVLSSVLTLDGRKAAWDLFSRIANLAFIVTAGMSVLVALFAKSMVGWEIGIAPGFGPEQQLLVVKLMRLNLIATMVFSLSGLVMAGLQANQHFLLPAMAPLLYNLGQIFGALVLSPEKGYSLGGFTLPAFGMGINGLVMGVIIGACLHLGIQIPGLLKYEFHWVPKIGLNNANVKKVLRVLGPRLLTMFIIQLIFLVRDNLASRLAAGSVSALTYGWMIQQLPETLIGTAIGTAILPTLAEYVTKKDQDAFQSTIQRAARVVLALSLPIGAAAAFGIRPLAGLVFGFDAQGTDLLMWVTRGYLLGLMGHSLLEIASRSFYAQQDSLTPLLGAVLNLTIYIGLGSFLYKPLGAAGVSLTDSLAFTSQAVLLFVLLSGSQRQAIRQRLEKALKVVPDSKGNRFQRVADWLTGGPQGRNMWMSASVHVLPTLLRASIAALIAGSAAVFASRMGSTDLSAAIFAMVGMTIGIVAGLPLVWSELRLLFRL